MGSASQMATPKRQFAGGRGPGLWPHSWKQSLLPKESLGRGLLAHEQAVCREPPAAQPCVQQQGVMGQVVARSLAADHVHPWVPDLCSYAHAKAVGGLLFSPNANQFSGSLQTLTWCPAVQLNSDTTYPELGFPDGTSGKELSCQCRRQT